MAKPMTAAQWRTAAKKFGIKLQEYSGWADRGRPGTFAPVGVVIHHTGSDKGQNSSSYNHFLFVEGDPSRDLPGPLCHATCEMDGDVIIGAAGRANHAGKGSSSTLAKVRADDAPLNDELEPGADGIDGNAQYYGLEVKYDGGQPMTSAQYRSAVAWAAAICDHHGWSAGSVIGHREHTRRKSDPGKCPMDKFRRDVAELLKKPGGGTTPTPPKEEGPTVQEIEQLKKQQADDAELAGKRWKQTQDTLKAHSDREDGRYAELHQIHEKVDQLTSIVQNLAAELQRPAAGNVPPGDGS